MLKFLRALKSRSSPPKNAQRIGLSRRLLPFSFKITWAGLLFILLAFLLSLAAINSGNSLLYVIVSALLSSLAVSGIVSRNSLKQISLSLQLPENVFVGDRVSIKVSAKNMKRIFPSFSIRIEGPELTRGYSPFRFLGRFGARPRTRRPEAAVAHQALFQQSAYFPILGAGEKRSQYTVQSFPRRGLYTLRGFWISTRFPFGFFRRAELVRANGEVLVYPTVREISSFFHLLPFLSGSMESMHAGLGENLFSLRKYQAGESARIIDWKATSKTGELMAREYAREEESNFCLVLDTWHYGGAGGRHENDFEKAVSLAASIAAHFLEEGASMSFLTRQEYVPRGAGIEHKHRILRSLALVPYQPAPPEADSGPWSGGRLSPVEESPHCQEILSDKVFKIILTSKPRGSFPSAIWRSSHILYFDEL